MVTPDSAAPSDDNGPTLEQRELLTAALNLNQLAAFDTAVQACSDFEKAGMFAAVSCGLAAEALNLDLDELITMMSRQIGTSAQVIMYIELTALPTGGEQA